MIITPGKFSTQPQYVAQLDKGEELTSGLVSAFVFDTNNAAIDRASGRLYPVTNAVTRNDKYGKCLYFDGTGDYVNLGTQTIGGVNLYADSTSQWSAVVCGRLEGSGNSGSFLAKCGSTNIQRTFQLYRDTSIAATDPAIWLRGGSTELNWDWNTADWHQYTVTWDGGTARIYGDYDREGVLTVGTASQEAENIVFGARTGGTGFLLTGRIAYGYFYNRAISRQESIELFSNPWQVFSAPSRRVSVSVGGGGGGVSSSVGDAAGTSTVSGVGASDSAQPGSSSGTSTVSGVGSSIVAAVGASAGLSTVSGIGASTVESVGSGDGLATVEGVGSSSTGGSEGSASGNASVSGVGASAVDSVGVVVGVALASGVGGSTSAAEGVSSGIATVSGVGDFTQAGSTVGTASGSSAVSGVGASVVAAVGAASGTSTAQAVSDSEGITADPGGGDDYPVRVVYKKRKKTLEEQPNKHLESIIDKAAEQVFGRRLGPGSSSTEINGLGEKTTQKESQKPIVGTNAYEDVKSLAHQEVVTEEVEKVAALLAQYHEQVRLVQLQEDEELLMLIAEMF